MGQPVVETDIQYVEKLEEISRQMEEVNGKKDQVNSDQGNQEIPDEELALNVDEPVDVSSMDASLEEGSKDEQNVAMKDGVDDSGSNSELSSQQADTASQNLGVDDEVGIDIEDELWDEGDAEEIPLFEEELLSEISSEEEKEQAIDEAEENEDAKSSGEESYSLVEEDASQVDVGDDGQDSHVEQHGLADDVEIGADDSEPSLVSKLIPWIVTAISTLLLVAGIFTFLHFWYKAQKEPPQVALSSEQTTVQKQVTNIRRQPVKASKRETVSQYEAIDLAPFIIPGKSGGELVFFKLQVELVVPDATTKQELLRRQAWLRDIIYQELKGLDISRGVQGDILDRYRAPLLVRLNREFSPMKIEDIRLMGYLLR